MCSNLHTNLPTLDIDECSFDSPCQYRCENTQGGYECSCPVGYELDDGKCEGEAYTVSPAIMIIDCIFHSRHWRMRGESVCRRRVLLQRAWLVPVSRIALPVRVLLARQVSNARFLHTAIAIRKHCAPICIIKSFFLPPKHALKTKSTF